MLFDLTPEVKLENEILKRYRVLRLCLYTAFSVFTLYAAFHILFPSLFFEFSFNNPQAKSNTITNPHFPENSLSPEKGMLWDNSSFAFNTSLLGSYSTAVVSFYLDKKSALPLSDNLSVQKTHAAFFYPEESPVGFKNGTLLKNQHHYYIISQNKLRQFRSPEIAASFGFDENAFLPALNNELSYNQPGEDIFSDQSYSDNFLFFIKNDYYSLENGALKKFISDKAFFSHYRKNQALPKNEDFFERYPLSSETIGFADSSLISYADSIYVVEKGNIFPIDNPLTFSGKGFAWNDVIPVGADEINFYKKEKLFTLANPHPQGSVLFVENDSSYYLIQEGKKHLLPRAAIVASWLTVTPVAVSKESSSIFSSCHPKKSFFSSRIFHCEIPIVELQKLIGSDYFFSLSPQKGIILDLIRIEFKKDIDLKNLRFTLGELLNRLKNNYAR